MAFHSTIKNIVENENWLGVDQIKHERYHWFLCWEKQSINLILSHPAELQCGVAMNFTQMCHQEFYSTKVKTNMLSR